MAWRTPSSLKWLILKRSSIAGELQQLEAEYVRVGQRQEYLSNRISEARFNLSAIDSTLALHEIQIEPSEIASTRPQGARLLPYGKLGQLLLRSLRGQPEWRSTSEIVYEVVRLAEHLEEQDCDRIRPLIRRRLHKLVKSGKVERYTSPDKPKLRNGEDEALWRLAM